MYPLGFLSGLGFDTASEVGLLSISGIQVSEGMLPWQALVFPGVITAEQARCYKPDPTIFEKAVRRLAVEPGHVAHVAEGVTEVTPARRLGCATVWVRQNGRSARLLTEAPDLEVPDLKSLAVRMVDHAGGERHPEVRRAGGRALVTDAEAWGETWRAHQDRYFQEHGIAPQVDATAAHPGEHFGPVRMRKVDSPAVARAEALRTANEAACRDPLQVLAALTRNNATFTERELDRYLAKHLGPGPDGMPDAAQVQDIAAAKTAVMGHKDVLVLHDRETGEVAGRFSTRTAREQERTALADGAAVAGARHHQGVKARYQEAAL